MPYPSYEEPEVTPVMKCHSCGETLLFGTINCRYCKQPIDPEYARQSAAHYTLVTKACSAANTIRTGRHGILLSLMAEGIGLAIVHDSRFLMLPPFICFLGYGVARRWVQQYGSIESDDAELVEAQKAISRDSYLWLAALLVELISLVLVRGKLLLHW